MHSSDAPKSQGRKRHTRPVIDENAAFPASDPLTRTSVGSRFTCCTRLMTVLIWSFWMACIQTVLLRLPGSGKVRLPRLYWYVVGRIMGLKFRTVGKNAGKIRNARDIAGGERPVVYISNHSSWLDIIAIGGVLNTVFVSKNEVGRWPLIGTISRLGRSIFVSRNRQDTGRELNDMVERLNSGDNMILFPEGTSSDGSRVLPFLSSFFAVAKPGRLEKTGIPKAPPLLIQPVSVVYDQLEGLPVGRSRRSVFSWYGDMDLAPHLWSFGQWRSMRATILLHPPLNPDDFKTRKELAQAAFDAVNDGAARLRQGLEP